MKFAVILGNLGNTNDRFLSSGYKETREKTDMFRQAVSIEGVRGMEFVGNWDISTENVKEMGKLLKDSDVSMVSIIPDHFSLKKWGKGAFTSRDPKIRREAVEHTKEMIDILVELGGELINLWPGQDGYDYILQSNFDEAYDWLIEGIRECARYKPEVKISLEFKPKEPRNFCYMARSADTLLIAQETGMDNVGVTIDVGHAFVGGENVAEAAYRLMRAGKLYHLHFNDNHQTWDDDMIVASVHTVQYVELLFWLKKMNYTGWWSMDQYPYREDGREALSESIEWIKALDRKMEAYGASRIEALVREGEATTISRELRSLFFG
jgi:xylose isomerase